MEVPAKFQDAIDKFRLDILGAETINRSVSETQAKFKCTTEAERHHYKANFRLERPLLRDLLNTVEEDDTVWDIGANVGLYSCIIGKRASVVAFEPQPANHERLNENLRLNGINAETHQIALGGDDGEISFEMDDRGEIAGAGRGTITAGDTHSSVTVRQSQGDTIAAQETPLPDIVKIDVEGAEKQVIDGMTNTLNNAQCRLVYCEVHIGRGVSESSVTKQLENLGFEISTFERSKNETTLVGRKNSI